MIKYFTAKQDTRDSVLIGLKSITLDELLGLLSTLQFENNNTDMILAMLTIINDLLLEVIVNPGSRSDKIDFPNLLMRGGKTVFNVFVYMAKSFYQQLCLMKSQFSLKLSGRSMLGREDTFEESSENITKKVVILNIIIEYCLFGLSYNPGAGRDSSSDLLIFPITNKKETSHEQLENNQREIFSGLLKRSPKASSEHGSAELIKKKEGFKPVRDDSHFDLGILLRKEIQENSNQKSERSSVVGMIESPNIEYPRFFPQNKEFKLSTDLNKGKDRPIIDSHRI